MLVLEGVRKEGQLLGLPQASLRRQSHFNINMVETSITHD